MELALNNLQRLICYKIKPKPNIYTHINRLIGLVSRVFISGPGDLGSVPGRVIQKTLKWYLIPPCLTFGNIRYGSRVKWSNLGKGVAPFPTHRCSSYWKGAFWSPSTTVANFTFLYTHTHMYTYTHVCVYIYTYMYTHTYSNTHAHTRIYIYIYHHVLPPARISLTLSCHFSLSFIASGTSSGLHPVSSHSCCMYVRADRPAFDRPYVGVHRSTSLMSSYLLLQRCPACLVCLTWIVFVMGGRWPYSWCLVGK